MNIIISAGIATKAASIIQFSILDVLKSANQIKENIIINMRLPDIYIPGIDSTREFKRLRLPKGSSPPHLSGFPN